MPTAGLFLVALVLAAPNYLADKQEVVVSDRYFPVPVSAAAAVAATYHKSAVVILAVSQDGQVLHTTTYGESAIDKEVAAQMGDAAAGAVGADLTRKTTYEDFRTSHEPAVYAEALEVIAEIARLGVGASLWPGHIARVEAVIRKAGKKP